MFCYIFLWLLFSASSLCKEYVRICYIMSWSNRRKLTAKFSPKDIPVDLCTHIIYAFAKIYDGQLKIDENDDETILKGIMQLNQENPTLKILLSVGGWSHEGTPISPFSNMVQTEGSRKKFISHAVNFLRENHFHGLDLDWEYPTRRGNSPLEDKDKFTLLCKELSEAFAEESQTSRLLLTAAVAAEESTFKSAYDISGLSKYLDSVHLLTFDFHGKWEGQTGHHTSMQESSDLSVNYGLDLWLRNGFPREKIVLGLAMYGRSYTLASSSHHGLDAPVSYGGEKGMFTGEHGFAAHYEICERIRNGMNVKKQNKAMSPYGFQGNYWVGYDDAKSIKHKVKTIIIDQQLKGAMFWTIDLDDFSGKFCLSGKFPLLNAVKDLFTNESTRTNEKGLLYHYVRVCYITSWARLRRRAARFTPKDIPAHLCTHIVYAFANIENGLLKTAQHDEKAFRELLYLKKRNPGLKISLAVGGWNHENLVTSPFSTMVKERTSRKRFINHSIRFLRRRNFDGLSLDWQYPTLRGNSPPEDKLRFTLLCEEFSKAFQRESDVTGGSKLLFTIAASALEPTIRSAYNISSLARYVDSLHLMSFDLHGPWEGRTGHHTTVDDKDSVSINRGLNLWIEGGFPSYKIVLGLATYGRSFQLQDPSLHDIGSIASSGGQPGVFTDEYGFAAYYEICRKVKLGMRVIKPNIAKAPYGFYDKYWVGYDDASSIRYKVKTLVQGHQLKGAMFRSIDLDDYTGKFCRSGKFPLLTAATRLLVGPRPTQPPPPPPTTTQRPKPKRTFIRACYFPSWAYHRAPPARFTPADIDPMLCTHIIYAFAKIDKGILTTNDENDDIMYKAIIGLKNKNPSIRIHLGVGGWNHESHKISPFSEMVRNQNTRKQFIDTTVELLRKYGFDGLDLDWIYPTQRNNSPAGDKQRFTALCQEIFVTFTNESRLVKKSRLALSVAVSAAGKAMIISTYAIRQFVKYVDTLHLMTYDLHGSWDTHTGHHTSMQQNDPLSVQQGLAVWLSGGIPKGKIVLGLAMYGRSFTLVDSQKFGIGAAVKGAGEEGKYVKEPGIAAYYEICEKITNGMVVVRDNITLSTFGHQGDYWVGYDDEQSLLHKVELIKGIGLKGAMFWSIDLDDFSGKFCGKGTFPLINAVKDAF